MKKRTVTAAVLAIALLAGAGIGTAYAYFTTFTSARGGHEVSIGDRTEVTEKFASWTKTVTITSDADSEPVYIRAKAFGPEKYPFEYSGEGWTLGDEGWYYYEDIIYGGESTTEEYGHHPLEVKITGVPEEEAQTLMDGDSFNVVVVYESTPVRYDEAGNPYADWDVILDSAETEGGGN